MAEAPSTVSGAHEKVLTGWHVLLIFIAFFGVMFVVNGIFLYSAVTSFPGEDVEKSYLQGIDYNSTLAARSAQAQRGWTAEIGLQGNDFVVLLNDAAGEPVSPEHVTGLLRHPTDAGLDIDLEFTRAGQGVFATARPAEVSAGRWALLVEARDQAEGAPLLTAHKYLVLP